MEQREISPEHTLCARAIYHPIQAQAINATRQRLKALEESGQKSQIPYQTVTDMTNHLHRQVTEHDLINLLNTPAQSFRGVQKILSARNQTLFAQPEKYESDMIDLSIMLKDPIGELTYIKWQKQMHIK
ncbi:MAG: hypothetical protein ACPG05_00275 [Bdellovibrionales bacterium]